jgi:uncharacterized membrane protein YhaH (DUF805 family)
VLTLFWSWAGFALVVKRLHDLDKPGWHYVWMFLLPGLLGLLGLIWLLLGLLYLLLARGTDGPNRFGYPP